jgi:hypothetical protein
MHQEQWIHKSFKERGFDFLLGKEDSMVKRKELKERCFRET